jgi:N5-(carboxyethyl)ornithine synthase
MSIAIFKTSLKENERRIPIHPEDLDDIPLDVLGSLVFEKGYGEDYGYSDWELVELGARCFAEREDLFTECDFYILPKPVAEDMKKMQLGSVLCGWTHAVQQRDITDIALEKKMTLIAWEEMNHVSKNGRLHVFYRNNELAGYAGVIHYLQLTGLDGQYGSKKKVVIFGYGSVSRGAIYALQGRGFTDITVYTQRQSHLVGDKIPNIVYKSFATESAVEDIRSAEVIFNGILQDVNKPLIYIKDNEDLSLVKNNAAIIDISCDKGMGFYFAEPTTFEKPIIYLERGIKYYSVDHTPTYLWNAASAEISRALVPHLKTIINPELWNTSEIINNAIDIKDGIIINKNIIKFQNR